MEEIEQIEKAITALEAQRSLLGDETVETALAPLREKLTALQSGTGVEQRKQVTILFADLVGFTALTEKTDPEDVREILKEYFAAWSQLIEQYHGVIEKYIGDAVMAVFGLSTSREQDPENAIRASLDMRRSLYKLNEHLESIYGISLHMRVGIHTGQVVVSTLEDRKGQSFVVVGDTVNLASRLQSAAPVDGILITRDTYRHVRGVFNVQMMDPVKMKGKTGEVQTYLVHDAKPRAFRMESRGVEGVETRMIGREAEFLRLQEVFFDVIEEGKWRVVTVFGEAGIGKSRLLYEFDNWLELRPESVIYFKGRGHPSTQEIPYSLFRSLFAFRFQIQDSDSPEEVREKIETGMHVDLPGDETGLMKGHVIGWLLGFEFGDSLYLKQRPADARQFQELSHHYLGSYFKGLAQNNPVALMIEDIHWADNSSLDLIKFLESYVGETKLLIVCTARTTLMERRPHWGEGELYHTQINVNPLTKRHTSHLFDEILQKVDRLPEELREFVVQNAGGNPFYVEELAKMLIDDGVIVKGPEQWRIEIDRLNLGRVPSTLVGVLQARLDSLKRDERMFLQRGAVIGRTFWDKAVEFLEKPEDSRSANESLPIALNVLRSREMVYKREKSTFGDCTEYLFKHALLRDVTYESLLKRQRQYYHERTARWLEQATEHIHRTDEYAALIAEHYEKAKDLELASNWYGRAGANAASRFANLEAVWAYSRALELLQNDKHLKRYEYLLARQRVYNLQGDREAQARDLHDLITLANELQDDSKRAEVGLEQARFLYITTDYPAAVTEAEKAILLSQASGSAANEAAAYLLLCSIFIRQGTFDTARENAEKALYLAQKNNLELIKGDILRHLGLVLYYLGNHQEALEYFEQAFDQFTKTGDRKGQGMAINNMGGATFELGNYSDASLYYERSYLLCREIGDRIGEGRSLNNLGIISVVQGNYGRAEEYYLEALKISRELGNRAFELSVLDNLGNLEQYRYNYPKSIFYHENALQGSREIGDKINESYSMLNIGRGYLTIGQHEKAYRYLAEVVELNKKLNDRQGICQALINLSQYHLDRNELEAALEKSKEVIDTARESDLRSELAAGYYSLGNVLFVEKKYPESIEAYQNSLEIHKALGEEKERISAKAKLSGAYLQTVEVNLAQAAVDEILDALEKQGSQGFEQPAEIFLACYRVLKYKDDPRAEKILEKGYLLLNECASKFDDELSRHSFLEIVPSNRELLEVWKESR